MFAAKSDTERSGRNRNHERSKCGRLRHTGPEDKQELIAPDDNVILRLGRYVRIVVSGQRNRLRVSWCHLCSAFDAISTPPCALAASGC